MPGDIIVLKMCAINAIHDVSFLKYGAQQRSFSVILDHFLPLPPNNLKNQNSVKKKKKPRDIIILHKCTKNHDHMLHCS